MQVSHVNNHVTHAVIGGKETIEFEISNSAEFFQILSSTLYKDQILAVVRETICNAWDAHIEAGCTDKPIQITLDNEKFVIRDYGKGIHHEDIGPIYGTYGNSTKKNDGKQTGGFGLGCKAPFAYVDHFEVQSFHEGMRTIYNMSKSNGEIQGKPGIKPIGSFPTTDSGLQVTIRIQPADRYRFKALIQQIIRNGDMNAEFNGDKVPTIGFDTSKSNYLIVQPNDINPNLSRVMVRYGNVIYPVEPSIEITAYCRQIEEHLGKMHHRYSSYYNIIFQAPPHSISVTPSRESLSMSDHTKKTLIKLMSGFLDTVKAGFHIHCAIYAEESVQNAVKDAKVSQLLSRETRLPSNMIDAEFTSVTISDLDTMARIYMQHHYPNNAEFRRKDVTNRLNKMVDAKLLDKGLVHTFLKTLDKETKTGKRQKWLQKQIIAPVMMKLRNAGLDTHSLFVMDGHNIHSRQESFHFADRVAMRDHLSSLPYLRNIVVLVRSMKNIEHRANRHEVMQKMGAYQGYLVYQVSLKAKEREAARQFFKDSGMTVVDIIDRQDWEPEVTRARSDEPRKPKKVGMVCLSALMDSYKNISTCYISDEGAARIEKPEFIVNVSTAQNNRESLGNHFSNHEAKLVIKLFGSKGGVTANEAHYHKWMKDTGAQPIKTYVEDKVVEYLQNTQAIKNYMAYSMDKLSAEEHRIHRSSNEYILKFFMKNETLQKTFKVVIPELTEEEYAYLHLFEHLKRYSRDKFKPLMDEFELIKVNPDMVALAKRICDSKYLDLISASSMQNFFYRHKDEPVEIAKAVEIITAVLN